MKSVVNLFLTILVAAVLLLPCKTHANEEPLYISLGIACTTSIVLKQAGLRQDAYPFDWVISPHDVLIHAFNDHFTKFFEHLNVCPGPDGSEDGFIDFYGFKFFHIDRQNPNTPGFDRTLTFIGDDYIYHGWHPYIPAAKAAFQRRIHRFKRACEGNRKVYFMRTTATHAQGPITKEDAICLRDTIRTNYPNLDFCLVIIGASEEYEEPWCLQDIKNYYGYRPDDSKWKGHWLEILQDLNSL